MAACAADGPVSEAEQVFLEGLQAQLQVSALDAKAVRADAEVVTTTPIVIGPTPASSQMAQPDELDKAITDMAILAGALELLPSALSTMAIIPLQLKLVYRVGQKYGFQLDQNYAKDFLATLGVGVTSQFLEGAASKILGGLFGGLGRQAASSGMSFATTYALGQVAKQYYAAGRKLDTAELKQTFARLLEEAKTKKDQYAQQIQRKVQDVKNSNLASLIKQQ
ncbi:MAG: GTPase [Deltaproteobacteria bacterium]|nr:GTPase [Deltaproteobacteria bacterium]